jgi:hypothetical protein
VRISLLVLFLLSTITGVIQAGPNEGVALFVHGVQGFEETLCLVPDTCDELIPEANPDGLGVELYYAVVVSPPTNLPSFDTIAFGIGEYDSYVCYVGYWGPCHSELNPLEIPDPDWPQPNTGTAISWAPHCFTDPVIPVYYFGFYLYYGDGGQVPLMPHPGTDSGVVSCEVPPQLDLFEEYGIMGCGDADGWNPECPIPTAVEATTWGRIKSCYR